MADQGQAPGARVKEEFLEQHLWPPFTQMQGLKPVVMERAEGALVWDSDGNEYIDAFASLWTVNVGHGRTEIHDAIKAQMEKLSIYHIFQIANEPAIKLADQGGRAHARRPQPRVPHARRRGVGRDRRQDGAPVLAQQGQGHQVHGHVPRALVPRHDHDQRRAPRASP